MWKNRLLSIIMSFVLIFSMSVPVFAYGETDILNDSSIVDNSNNFDWENELENVVNDIRESNESVNLEENEEDIEDVIYDIQNGDLEELEPELREELQAIDELAQYYYDYYIENGHYPDETNTDTEGISPRMSAGEGVSILSSAGFYITSTNLAKLCATLGGLAAADGPLPVGDVIAIVLGVTVLTVAALNYIDNLDRNRYSAGVAVGNAFPAKASQAEGNAINAIATTAVLARARRSGYKHFSCVRFSGYGGGIIIQNSISETTAISRLLSYQDVYSITTTDASGIARKATNSTPVHDYAHNLGSQPLNRPHWHPTRNGVRIDVHSFY